jgi:PAS domain S-box-containing protein
MEPVLPQGPKARSQLSRINSWIDWIMIAVFGTVISALAWVLIDRSGVSTRSAQELAPALVLAAAAAGVGLILSIMRLWAHARAEKNLTQERADLEERSHQRIAGLEAQVDELTRSKSLLRSMINTTHDLIFFKNEKSMYVGCNTAFLGFLQKEEDEVVGHLDYDLYPSEMAGVFRRSDRQVMATGQPEQTEEWVVFPDGTRRFLVTLKSPMVRSDGEIQGILGISRDLTDRKLVEQELMANEEKFKNIFENMEDGYFKTSLNGEILLVNRSAAKLLGYETLEDLLAKNLFTDICAKTDLRDVLLRTLKESKRIADSRIEFKCKDGTIILTSGSIRLVAGQDGQEDTIESILRDDTARIRSETELWKEKETAQRYLDVAGVILVVIQADHTVSMINRMGCDILGYHEDDILGRRWFENYLPQKINPEIALAFDQVVADRMELKEDQEYPLVTGTGDERLVRWHHIALRDENGKITAVLSSGEDVTEQRKAEAENRKLSRAIEQSPISVVITDYAGTIEYVNPYFTDLTGYSAAEVLGKNPKVLKSGQTTPEEYEHLWQTIKAGGVWQGEFRNRKKNGDLFWEACSISPITDADGQITHFIAVKEDITERKQADEELRQAHKELELTNTELQEANKAKSQFLANMSHEIRTPLNAIIGMTSLLLDTPLDAEQRDFAETVRNSGEVLLTLINDILDFSKIEAQKMELENQAFDLRSCVEGALDLLAPAAAQKKLDLAYMMGSSLPACFIGDVTRLRQILVNLLGNAIKFTDSGEVVVSVAGQMREDDWYQIHISVRDTGIGIPADRIDRLFRSFSQVDASTTRKFGGTGLGLAISKRISELMGGTMWVESSGVPGQGSTFHFTIQAKAAPDQPDSLHRDQAKASIADRDVLIVDDSKTNRQILVKQCLTWSMYPTAVASAREALALIDQNEHFDLAILDMQMPEMDGLTLAAEIRKRRADLAMVMLSSLGYREARSEIDLFAAYLTKPIKPNQLFDVLQHVIARTDLPERKPTQEARFDKEVGQRNPLRILMAEDNVINQKVTLSFLVRLGYRADVVANGREAIDALKRQPYDVILMDVQMPEMDGETATRLIRQQWPLEEQPRIIAMTANALQGDREHYLSMGMDDYVSKPINVDELTRALRESRPLGNTGEDVPEKMPETVPEAAVSTGAQEKVPEIGAAAYAEPDYSALDALRMGDGDPWPVTAKTEPEAASSNPGRIDSGPKAESGEAEIPATIHSTTADSAVAAMPAQIPPAEPSRIDYSVLKDFAEIMGEDGELMARELVAMFLKDAQTLIDEIRTGISQAEAGDVRRAAHTLKGNCNQTGAKEMAAMCLDLEKLAKTGVLDGAEDHLDKIAAEFIKVDLEFREHFQIRDTL